MKIGVFDSGLGGLLITHSLISALPEYDYIYLGDTARVPYGDRSSEEVYDFTRQAVEYLFANDCELIIIACNTASSEALRRIQRDYLPVHYPDRRVLGVLVPAAESAVEASKSGHIGVLATIGTVKSGAFEREVLARNSNAKVTAVPAPKLVPLVEDDALDQAGPLLDEYLLPFKDIDTLILGCTHYPFLKDQIRSKLSSRVRVISQDEVLPEKLASYLSRHPEIESQLSRGHGQTFQVTETTEAGASLAARLFGQPVELQLVAQFSTK
jgi:glutamate racemase